MLHPEFTQSKLTMNKQTVKNLLQPKNWLLYLTYLIVRLLLLLPYSILMYIGSALGLLAFYTFRGRRNIAETNISLCFPQLNAKQQKQLVKANMISSGKTLFETAMAYWSPDKKMIGLYEIEGLNNLEKALEAKHGVILLSAHFTMLDLAVRMLNITLDKPAHMMYRKHNDPFIESFIHKGRIKHCGKTIGKKDVGGILESLANNNAIWYAPDQNFKYHMVFAPFFGIQAATVTGTTRLASESNAKVVPFFFYRKPNNEGYTLEFQPALENFPCGDKYQDTVRINQLIEEAVKKHPEQYLWTHRRFKTRPPGEPLIYPKKKKR
jgi:Kdo2-lipid IVA lauroyltransferase/acyltransferase